MLFAVFWAINCNFDQFMHKIWTLNMYFWNLQPFSDKTWPYSYFWGQKCIRQNFVTQMSAKLHWLLEIYHFVYPTNKIYLLDCICYNPRSSPLINLVPSLRNARRNRSSRGFRALAASSKRGYSKYNLINIFCW